MDWFIGTIFTEPHSTKQFEDGVRYGWASTGEVMDWCRTGWQGFDVRDHARRVRCPTLVIHGDADGRVPYPEGEAVHALVPGARMITIAGGGHVTAARDPVLFNRAVRDFVEGAPRAMTWTRAMQRPRKVLFISSPIGLGHVQRDLAIARELRLLHPDIAIDWFTVDPAARYLEQEGERVHPITARLANESRHFEHVAGEHDLHAFFALRTMDEIMANNFMTFCDLVDAEHYDLVIGDEAWDVDYYYHENPELKRQPFVFLTDFVGCLPTGRRRARGTPLRRSQRRRDRARGAISGAARRVDLHRESRRRHRAPLRSGTPAHPRLDRSQLLVLRLHAPLRSRRLRRHRTAPRSARLSPRRTRRHRRGRRDRGRGASAQRIAEAHRHMRREEPSLRTILVAGPRLDPARIPRSEGLEVRPYVHHLFEHLACCDLALVQGGLSTCMELVATRRPFLSFPLQRHFEQRVHVRQRLANYDADRAVEFAGLTPESLATRALEAMHAPVRYRAVETDGAARAARRIAEVLDNRWWVGR